MLKLQWIMAQIILNLILMMTKMTQYKKRMRLSLKSQSLSKKYQIGMDGRFCSSSSMSISIFRRLAQMIQTTSQFHQQSKLAPSMKMERSLSSSANLYLSSRMSILRRFLSAEECSPSSILSQTSKSLEDIIQTLKFQPTIIQYHGKMTQLLKCKSRGHSQQLYQLLSLRTNLCQASTGLSLIRQTAYPWKAKISSRREVFLLKSNPERSQWPSQSLENLSKLLRLVSQQAMLP